MKPADAPAPIDPVRIAAAIAQGWKPRLGRVDAEEAGRCRCSRIEHEAGYRARWERGDERHEQLLCVARAAAWADAARAAGADVPFPPGRWRDDDTVGRPPQVFPIPEGTPMATCSSCRAPIRWIVTEAGRRMPVNLDGTSHFVTCPNADAHRKAR